MYASCLCRFEMWKTARRHLPDGPAALTPWHKKYEFSMSLYLRIMYLDVKLSLFQEDLAYLYLGVPLEPLAGGHGRHGDDGKAAC